MLFKDKLPHRAGPPRSAGERARVRPSPRNQTRPFLGTAPPSCASEPSARTGAVYFFFAALL